MSKVTALVSAYFAEEYMTVRLQNLFAQKPAPEIIVVCQEGSAEHKAASDYNVRIITTPDIPTIGKAWNMAIEQASGDYLTTANTDDLFTIGGLKKLSDILDNMPEVDLVFSAVNREINGEVAPWYRIHTQDGLIDPRTLYDRCIIGAMPVWRRSIHAKIGKFDEFLMVAADYDMWLKMALNSAKFYYTADICGTYTNRADSLEHRNVNNLWFENIEIRRRYADMQ